MRRRLVRAGEVAFGVVLVTVGAAMAAHTAMAIWKQLAAMVRRMWA